MALLQLWGILLAKVGNFLCNFVPFYYAINTRMRDFYDIYILFELKGSEIDFEILKAAIVRTATKRGSLDMMKDSEEILQDIENDSYLNSLWRVYINENKYIGELDFRETIDVIKKFSKGINL